MEQILLVNNVTKSYSKAKVALNNVYLDLPKGHIIGLLGPNGSGKTTLLKLCAGLLTPNAGQIQICGIPVGQDTKALVSYLPDRTYFRNDQTVRQQMDYFKDFYADFDYTRAENMLQQLNINPKSRFGALSKGNKEKVQLILVMSRSAKLYLLDEPIAGVDPAARDLILDTILANYNPDSTVIISTHLIGDIERVLDEVIFLKDGNVVLHDTTDNIREREGKSIDALFREMFRATW